MKSPRANEKKKELKDVTDTTPKERGLPTEPKNDGESAKKTKTPKKRGSSEELKNDGESAVANNYPLGGSTPKRAKIRRKSGENMIHGGALTMCACFKNTVFFSFV